MLIKGVAAGVPSTPGYLPGIYIQKLESLAEEKGLDIAALLAQLPESIRYPLDHFGTAMDVRYEDYLILVRVVLHAVARAERGHCGGLGLRFGSSFGVPDYGILGYAMLSCRDLGQCLRTFRNLNDLFSNLAELERKFVWREGEVAYQCTAHLHDDDIARFELETALAQFTVLRSLLAEPEQFQFQRVCFSFAEPARTADYHRLFRCSIFFNQPVTEVVVPETMLEESFALANKEARAACQRQCEGLLRGMESAGMVSERVRQFVLQVPGNIPDLDQVARQLNLSSRTLRRKLAQENTTYHEIVKNVREHLARRYLSDTALEIKEISYLLGYSEVANFQRAFKKWVGQAPGQYRSVRAG